MEDDENVNQVSFRNDENSADYRLNKIKTKEQEMLDGMRYEYYIHYLGIDRRNDRWVTEQFLKVDKEEIGRQKKIINEE